MVDRKALWARNYNNVKEEYASVTDLKWRETLSYDTEVFTHILADIIKAEGKRPKPGKRPALDRQSAQEALSRLSGAQFSDRTFVETFSHLVGDRSYRHLAQKTGIHKDTVHKLMHGKLQPSNDTMEAIAAAFGKDPAYFLEYRVHMILAMVGEYLKDAPETATAWYLRARGNGKFAIK